MPTPDQSGESIKVWGKTRLIFKQNCVEVHLLSLRTAGGCQVACSWHKHAMKHNLFVVLAGKLRIERENQSDVVLKCGSIFTVPPGVVHRFVVVESGEAIEVTWAEGITEDIERLDTGHILKAFREMSDACSAG